MAHQPYRAAEDDKMPIPLLMLKVCILFQIIPFSKPRLRTSDSMLDLALAVRNQGASELRTKSDYQRDKKEGKSKQSFEQTCDDYVSRVSFDNLASVLNSSLRSS